MTALHLVVSTDGKLNDRITRVLKTWGALYGISQTRLAEELGITQPGISQRFLGRVPFNTAEIERIADFYQTTPAVVMGYANDPEPNPRPRKTVSRRRGSSGPRSQQWRTLSTPLKAA